MQAFAAGASLPLRRAHIAANTTHCCKEPPSRFKKGDTVRVAASPLVMYHIPKALNKPTDVSGKTGSVFKVVDEVKGHDISATKPVVVKFEDPKFMAHFDDSELEAA